MMSPPRRRFLRCSLTLVSMIALTATASGGGLQYTVGTESFAIERLPKVAGTMKRPIVILLHGVDGLSDFSRPQILGFAEELAKAGYVVFVPTYFGTKDGPVGGFPEL